MVHTHAAIKTAANGADCINIATAFSSPNSCKNSKNWGPKFLLSSLVGTTSAAGLFITRYLLLETGGVLLLFGSENLNAGVCTDNSGHSWSVDAIDPDHLLHAEYSRQCTNNNGEDDLLNSLGGTLLSVATSPHLRAAPIILLFLSSTVFLVGVILTQREFRQCLSWIQTCQTYGEQCSKQLMSSMGVSNQSELADKLKATQVQLQKIVREKVQGMDGLILDDVLRKWTKMGTELAMGVWGGLVLYSLPDEMFQDTLLDARGTRRRLVAAADPTLEHVLFQPGGVKDLIPPVITDSLTNQRRVPCDMKLEVVTDIASVDSMQKLIDDDNDEESSDTPLVAHPMSSGRVKNGPIHDLVPLQIVQTSGGEKVASESDDETSRETIADALSGTINDLVVSKMLGNHQPRMEKIQARKNEEDTTVPPNFQLEVWSRRVGVAATLLFLCHLRSSSSTRRAWASTVRVLTSLGLVSTAIGAGGISTLLSIKNPIVGMLCSKIMDSIDVPSPLSLSPVHDARNRIQQMITQLRDAIRKNKQLQSTLAMIVFYGTKSLLRRGASRSIQSRRGIQ